jgi:two-component system OmpR family sensor kinase
MSLRLRLALWYGGLTAAVVALVCAYSYAVHSRTHYDELDGVLRAMAGHVAEELETATADDYVDILDASYLLGAVMRVRDAQGRLLKESSHATVAPVVNPISIRAAPSVRPYPWIGVLAPALHNESGDHGTFGLSRGPDSQRWRVYVMQMRGGEEYLTALLPLGQIDQAVSRFGMLMLLMALLGGLATFVAGWLLAQRALRPVASLTSTAGAIAQSRTFSRRVPLPRERDELGRLATTFNEMLASLDDAYQAQSRFVSAASHEMRAPLTVIQANLELLHDRGAQVTAPDRERAIREAWLETSRLSRLVADLLSLARADAGVPLRRDRVELDRVLMTVFGEARHLAQGQRFEIAALEPTIIIGDADRLKQLLLNLVDNAVKYTPPSGRVSASLRQGDRHAEVIIRDTGIGISPKDLPHVFERFYRADPARSRDPGGTGLGLPIARWIVDQHGGTLELSSVAGHGVTAVVRLPV